MRTLLWCRHSFRRGTIRQRLRQTKSGQTNTHAHSMATAPKNLHRFEASKVEKYSRKCTEMIHKVYRNDTENVQKCTENVQNCKKMYRNETENVQNCKKMCRNYTEKYRNDRENIQKSTEMIEKIYRKCTEL